MSEGVVVFVTGLPSSGKSSLARELEQRLRQESVPCARLDGDELRECLVPPPGYGAEERDRFYETLGRLAALLAKQGLVVLVAATANRRAHRDGARVLAPRFLEVWVATDIEECRRRDTKGLYAAFRKGKVQSVPGEDAAYEEPAHPDVVARGGIDEQAIADVLAALAAPLAG